MLCCAVLCAMLGCVVLCVVSHQVLLFSCGVLLCCSLLYANISVQVSINIKINLEVYVTNQDLLFHLSSPFYSDSTERTSVFVYS